MTSNENSIRVLVHCTRSFPAAAPSTASAKSKHVEAWAAEDGRKTSARRGVAHLVLVAGAPVVLVVAAEDDRIAHCLRTGELQVLPRQPQPCTCITSTLSCKFLEVLISTHIREGTRPAKKAAGRRLLNLACQPRQRHCVRKLAMASTQGSEARRRTPLLCGGTRPRCHRPLLDQFQDFPDILNR